MVYSGRPVEKCEKKMCDAAARPGRSTASRDGQALAWAIAEQLVDRGALTLFVTHYAKLTQLGALYPSASRLSDDAWWAPRGVVRASRTHLARRALPEHTRDDASWLCLRWWFGHACRPVE